MVKRGDQPNIKVFSAILRAAGLSRLPTMAGVCSASIALAGSRMRKRFFGRRVIEPKDRPHKAPVYVMKANYGKLVHVALVLLHEAERIGLEATQTVLNKAVFFADRRHLNKYGRPITWDWYLAMPKGPVPMTFYNMLMGDPEVVAKTGAPQWDWRSAGDDGKRVFYGPRMPPDLEWVLSPSDVEELHAALAEIKRLGIWAAVEEAHKDPAWLDAWDGDGGGPYKPMSLELFFDKPDPAEALTLSRHAQLCN